MEIIIKNYQRTAIDQLKRYFSFYINENNGLVVFKAPTGSGKTIMASKMIEELVLENPDTDFCFVWASIGWADLHLQSFDSVKDYLGGNPKCTLLDTDFFGTRHFINKHEVVFVNWEKLVLKDGQSGEWKNTLMKDQEGSSFLSVIRETKDRGTKIILIVDEAHRGTQAVNTRIKEFREQIIEPTFTYEMSATPANAPNVNVSTEDVIREGMIKKDLIVNEGVDVDMVLDEEITSEIYVLQRGYDKRNELLKEYAKIDSLVKPLVLIQIPNSEQGDAKIETILDFFRPLGITLQNKKLKIWTSEYKLTSQEKKDIKSFSDPTEYLVFKTAVATGWDCPRAHVLVKFRDGNSESFEIQTIGRILRTAEAKSYDSEILDNAYIFTNLSNFITTRDSYSPNRIKTEMSYFRTIDGKSVYKPIDLLSFYRSREGDYNSADTEFYGFFETEFRTYFDLKDDDIFRDSIEKKLKLKNIDMESTVLMGILSQTGIELVRIDESQQIDSENVYIKMSDNDIQFAYYNFIRQNLSGLAYVRSKSSVNGAITETLVNNHIVEKSNKIISTQKFILRNIDTFTEILSSATKKFRDYLGFKINKKGVREVFNIEDNRAYSRDTYKIHNSRLSLYQPLRVRFRDEGNIQIENYLESSFIDYLDRLPNIVEWFWVNGSEQVVTNFGIGYDNDLSTFQPDFIVKFKDGRIGIFDTKPIGDRIEDTTKKAIALQEYIISENARRKEIGLGKVFGGIVCSNSYDGNTKRYSNFILSS